jgi:hypothetical protein
VSSRGVQHLSSSTGIVTALDDAVSLMDRGGGAGTLECEGQKSNQRLSRGVNSSSTGVV